MTEPVVCIEVPPEQYYPMIACCGECGAELSRTPDLTLPCRVQLTTAHGYIRGLGEQKGERRVCSNCGTHNWRIV